MKNWLAKRRCKKLGHQWGEFKPNNDGRITARIIAGWDRFTATCSDCGVEYHIEKHWTDDSTPVPPRMKGREK